MLTRLLFILSLISSASLWAEEASVTMQPSPLDSVSLLQTVLGLLLVLACIFLAAWLFKGMHRMQNTAHDQFKIISGLPLGTRERLLVVQVGQEQVLIGVTQQQITKLHTLAEPITHSQAVTSDFAKKLKSMIQQSEQKS